MIENWRDCSSGSKGCSNAPLPSQIVHVSSQDPLRLVGGQGWAVFNLCKAQVHKGFRVVWVSPCIRDETACTFKLLDGHLTVVKLPLSSPRVLTLYANDQPTHARRVEFAAKAVDYILKTYSPHECVVHLHGINAVPTRARELRRLGYNVTSTFHFFLSPRIQATRAAAPFGAQLKRIEQQAIEANDKVIVNSTGMAEEVRTLCPDFTGRLFVIPNGIGDEFFAKPNRGGSSSSPVVTAYGRISPEKGFHLLVEAARLITQDRRKTRRRIPEFVIFGNSDEAISARKEYLDTLRCRAVGYPNIRIVARPGGIQGTAKMHLIERTTVGVVPSLYEPFGLVLAEFLSRGVPVVSTLTAGARDILEAHTSGKNRYGFIVGSGVDSLVNALEYLLRHPAERHRMSQNALARAEHFRWSQVLNEVIEVYRAPQATAAAGSNTVNPPPRAGAGIEPRGHLANEKSRDAGCCAKENPCLKAA